VRHYERALYVALLMLLVWLPLPLGSNRGWAWAIMEAAVFTLLAATVIASLLYPGLYDRRIQQNRMVILALLLWLAYVGFQLVSLPASVLHALSPGASALYDYTLGAEDAERSSIAIDRGAALTELLKYAAYSGLLLLVLALVDSRRRLKLLAFTIVGVGVMQALIGLIAHFVGVDLVPADTLHTAAPEVLVRGTFVNRNHFGAFVAMTIAVGLGLAIGYTRRSHRYPGWRERIASLADRLLETRMQVLLLIVVMFAALFFSRSRGANAAFFVSLVCVLGATLLLRGWRTPELRLAPLVLLFVAVAAVWFGTGGLAERVLGSDIGLDERFDQWRISANVAADYWLVGVGAGNYENVFPLYRDGSLRPLFYDHAHNDYLELFIEQGVVGSLLLGTAVGAALLAMLRALGRRRDMLMRGLIFGSLTGIGVLLVHGLAEFNFRIPANAAYFFVILGMGLVASHLPHATRKRPGGANTAPDADVAQAESE
jgi:putative inorganic carbon (HCO3(-)) transporter